MNNKNRTMRKKINKIKLLSIKMKESNRNQINKLARSRNRWSYHNRILKYSRRSKLRLASCQMSNNHNNRKFNSKKKLKQMKFKKRMPKIRHNQEIFKK